MGAQKVVARPKGRQTATIGMETIPVRPSQSVRWSAISLSRPKVCLLAANELLSFEAERKSGRGTSAQLPQRVSRNGLQEAGILVAVRSKALIRP
jgi:hypothetical protein